MSSLELCKVGEKRDSGREAKERLSGTVSLTHPWESYIQSAYLSIPTMLASEAVYPIPSATYQLLPITLLLIPCPRPAKKLFPFPLSNPYSTLPPTNMRKRLVETSGTIPSPQSSTTATPLMLSLTYFKSKQTHSIKRENLIRPWSSGSTQQFIFSTCFPQQSPWVSVW